MPTIRVKIDNRNFIVDFSENWEAVRIKERKLYAAGTLYEGQYNAPYWSAKHHQVGSEKTIVARIIEKALNDKPKQQS
jgi:hypothetical protein